MATQIKEKRKFVADAAFYADLKEVLTRELAEDGSGVEVPVNPMPTETRVTPTQNVLDLGDKGKRCSKTKKDVQEKKSEKGKRI
uniref:40S ribosomal protein S3-3 n=2 Tax=Noccaea caerulescens TaxID=107243 RepID=A0A1J3D6R0_NOCCA